MPSFPVFHKLVGQKLHRLARSSEPGMKLDINVLQRRLLQHRGYLVEILEAIPAAIYLGDHLHACTRGSAKVIRTVDPGIPAPLTGRYVIDHHDYDGDLVEVTISNWLPIEFDAGDVVFVQKDMSGDLWIISFSPPAEILRISPLACLHPGSQNQLSKLYRLVDCQWTYSQKQVAVNDECYQNFMLADECTFARARPGCFFQQGDNAYQVYDLVGSYGLVRRALVLNDIDCRATGALAVLDYRHEETCVGLSSCQIQACNGETNEEGRRKLYSGEVVSVVFLNRHWHILPQPIATFFDATSATLCPDDQEGTVSSVEPLAYCAGIKTSEEIASARNVYHLATKNLNRALLAVDPTHDDGYKYVQVEHKCHDIAANYCDEPLFEALCTGSGSQVTAFELKASSVRKASIMSCEEPERITALSMPLKTAVRDWWVDGYCFRGLVGVFLTPPEPCYDESEETFSCGEPCPEESS